MTISVINALILLQIVLIYLNSVPVLAANDTLVHKSYIGSDAKDGNFLRPCILSAFRVTLTTRPANQTFRGTTYRDLTPEVSATKQTVCQPSVAHYYRYDDHNSDMGTNQSHQSLLSLGFEVASDRSVDIHYKYIEILCPQGPRGCFRAGFVLLCNPQWSPKDMAEKNCYTMSGSHHLDFAKPNQSRECSHNSKVTMKDIAYYDEIPVMKGSFEVKVEFYRIDVISGEYTGQFSPVSYCLKDWLLDMNTLIISGCVAGLLMILIAAKCVCDSRRSAKRRISRKLRVKEEKKLTEEIKCHKDSEPLESAIEL